MKDISIIFLITLAASISSAQITVQQNQLEPVFVIGDSLNALFSNDSTMDVGQTGGPNIYDLRPLHVTSLKLGVEVGSSIPIVAPHFPNDTVLATPGSYNIVYFSGNEMFGPGHVDPLSDTSYKVDLKRPGEVLFDFPLTYEKDWSYSFDNYDSTYINGTANSTQADSESRTTTVDGYGTLILPGGDSLQCLRLFQGPENASSDTGYGDFTFMYVTTTGTFVIINSPGNEPTTGRIAIENALIVEGQIPTSVRATTSAPGSFVLNQNFPNPFNPSTTIRFDLSEQSNVMLEIYDDLGRRVLEENYGIMDAGDYKELIDMEKFASGLYFCRIDALGRDGERFESIKKLVLIK